MPKHAKTKTRTDVTTTRRAVLRHDSGTKNGNARTTPTARTVIRWAKRSEDIAITHHGSAAGLTHATFFDVAPAGLGCRPEYSPVLSAARGDFRGVSARPSEYLRACHPPH